MLQTWGLWSTVSEGTLDYTEERMALEMIAKVVPLELLGSITSKVSTKEAWDMIILRNVGVDRVRKAKASSLKQEFDAITFLNGELIDDFAARLGRIRN
jgi:hypothetical protein